MAYYRWVLGCSYSNRSRQYAKALPGNLLQVSEAHSKSELQHDSLSGWVAMMSSSWVCWCLFKHLCRNDLNRMLRRRLDEASAKLAHRPTPAVAASGAGCTHSPATLRVRVGGCGASASASSRRGRGEGGAWAGRGRGVGAVLRLTRARPWAAGPWCHR